MNLKITKAIQRLSKILPLQENLASLEPASKMLYQEILSCFITHGRPPTSNELNKLSHAADEIIQSLSGKDMITVNERNEITGAYPFTTEQRVHQLHINNHHLHAMCALDALAPSAMFNCQSSIDSRCDLTHKPVHIELDNKNITRVVPEDIHFAINWQAACSTQSCSKSLCTEMIFLYDLPVAENWRDENPAQRELFTLPEAIEFAAGFFVPLLQ